MGLLERVCEMLHQDEWVFSTDAEQGMAIAIVRGMHAYYSCVFLADDELECLTLYTDINTKVPEIKRLRICDFLNRANHGLVLGSFEMNMLDGDVSFRVALPVCGCEFSLQQLRTMISASIFTFDRYYPGIMNVIYHNALPGRAVAECETKDEQETEGQ